MTIRVAVIESNPVAREFLCRVVRESFSDELQIDQASDVATGLATVLGPDASGAARLPCRLVLVDLGLPGQGALNLLSELKDHPALRIVTTLFADDELLFPAIRRGAQGYLLKEDRLESVVEALQQIAQGQWPLPPSLARRMMNHLWPASEERGSPSSPPPAASGTRAALACFARGMSPKEAARHLGTGQEEIRQSVQSIYRLCQQGLSS